ncbi:MAG: tetratricopeptide repeat protein [Terriglobia bacterium]
MKNDCELFDLSACLSQHAIMSRMKRVLAVIVLLVGNVQAQTGEAEFQRGLALGEQRNFRGAVESFSRAIAINPRYERAYYFRAQAQAFLGNYEAAIADYDKALQFKPGYYAYVAGRTEANRDRGMLGLAVR